MRSRTQLAVDALLCTTAALPHAPLFTVITTRCARARLTTNAHAQIDVCICAAPFTHVLLFCAMGNYATRAQTTHVVAC
eukprot:8096617-Lingulodinium_polyedra.AAC.1